MARKVEFDREKVLQKAMRIFWEKGYTSTSLEDLVNAMDINRFSIYNSFGDKKALFIASLEQYQRSVFDELLKPLAAESSGMSCIDNYLDNLGKQLLKSTGKLGCMVQKTGQSSVLDDEQIAGLIQGIVEDLRQVLRQQLERAVERGELEGRVPVEQMVDFILTSTQGLILLRRIREDEEFISQQVNLLKQMLRTW